MDISIITDSLLKQTLTAFQHGHALPEKILALTVLRQFEGKSTAERQIYLRDWMHKAIRNNLQQQRKAHEQSPPHTEPCTKQQIIENLAIDFSHNNVNVEAWSSLYHRYCTPVRMRVNEMAKAASVVPRHFNRRLQTGLNFLVDQLRREEMEANGRFHTQHLRRHLPPPDHLQLFGLDNLLADIREWLITPDAAPFLSIEGLGGIGKTTTARTLAYYLAENNNWHDILWISARQQQLNYKGEIKSTKDTARTVDDIVIKLVAQSGQTHLAGLTTLEKLDQLRPFFTTTPYLVIIDNLETATDVTALLPSLQPLAGQTRFLLTSRHTLSSYPFVTVRSVPILSLTNSHLLVQSELTRRNLPIQLTQNDIRQLYAVIGGLPLALKLVAAQLRQTSLQNIIQQLRRANSTQPYGMYTYIYRQSWELLDNSARRLLLSALDIAPEGDTVAWLRLMGDLPDNLFDTALSQLFDYSLLEPISRQNTPACRMHRLTATFLQTDILGQWHE